MIRVNQVKLKTGHSEADLRRQTARALRIPEQNITELKIVRQSIDARKKPLLFYSYSVDVAVKDEGKILHRFRGKENLVCRAVQAKYRFPTPGSRERKGPAVIVGTGPAGLFCGYFLALHGYRPILLERGRCVEERRRDVETFWETGNLDTASNVQFGEGGAGTFSDGKLNTLVKDRDGRNRAVLETFVKFGAKESICYEAKPHIGTDVLCDVVRRMREEIIRLGGEVRFESRVTDIRVEDGRVRGVVVERPDAARERTSVERAHSEDEECPVGKVRDGEERRREYIECGQLVLAIGHSARDTFSMLSKRGVPMEAKSFAVGLRVEHPQRMINESQYGTEEPGDLGAAPYKVTAKTGKGRGVYSFCMCPGGYVVNASSEEGRTAVNGMSYSDRGGQNANSAIIVTVTPEDFGSEHPLAGIVFQRRLEERAYAVGGGKIPVQRYGDFRRCVEESAGEDRGIQKRSQARGQEGLGDWQESLVKESQTESLAARQGSQTESTAAKQRSQAARQGSQEESPAARQESQAARQGSQAEENQPASRESQAARQGNQAEESQTASQEGPAASQQEQRDGRKTCPQAIEAKRRGESSLEPQCRGAWTWADVSRILPGACNEAIVEGMETFGRQIAGFDSPDACLSGVESRTSSAVRIRRDDHLQSEIRGLYPCGEGAGFAGGIVSAAMDGIRVAEAIAGEFAP